MAGLFNRLVPSTRPMPSRYRALLRMRRPRSETTASRGLMLSMVATAFTADAASAWACHEKPHHGRPRLSP